MLNDGVAMRFEDEHSRCVYKSGLTSVNRDWIAVVRMKRYTVFIAWYVCTVYIHEDLEKARYDVRRSGSGLELKSQNVSKFLNGIPFQQPFVSEPTHFSLFSDDSTC